MKPLKEKMKEEEVKAQHRALREKKKKEAEKTQHTFPKKRNTSKKEVTHQNRGNYLHVAMAII